MRSRFKNSFCGMGSFIMHRGLGQSFQMRLLSTFLAQRMGLFFYGFFWRVLFPGCFFFSGGIISARSLAFLFRFFGLSSRWPLGCGARPTLTRARFLF
jgi:hypothetical protein